MSRGRKFTPTQRRNIAREYTKIPDATTSSLARKYEVSTQTIHRILKEHEVNCNKGGKFSGRYIGINRPPVPTNIEKANGNLFKHRDAFRESLRNKQKNRCPVCRNKFTPEQETHVDHCHKTKRIRGLLCRGCNHGLGNFNDDPRRLARAIEYLSK